MARASQAELAAYEIACSTSREVTITEPMLLERIARTEQELRTRLLATRARADAMVVEARKKAEEVRAAAESSSATETRSWLEQELARAHRETEQAVARATVDATDLPTDSALLDVAVQLIVDAVLLAPVEAAAHDAAEPPDPEGTPTSGR